MSKEIILSRFKKKPRVVLLAALLVCSLGIFTPAKAQQDSLFVLPDSSNVFTLENFYALILRNHPVARQINLLSDVAKQEIRLARGNFDPKIEFQYQQKNFNNTEYYELLKGGVKFPSVLPFDPKVGVERNQGQYLNPENYIANDFNYQQFYAGVSMPLGQGLITDERRVALKQAELFSELTEAEQVKLTNKLLLDAAKDYWQWYYAYYNFRIQNRGVNIASEIFKRVKLTAQQGEASVIDTVQAQITLQERLIQQQEALLDFQNSGVVLSTYLWDSVGTPLALTLNWAPVRDTEYWAVSEGELLELKEQAKENHPELQKLSVKLQQLELDRKLAKEFLKPKLDVSYTFLNQPFDPEWNYGMAIGENYKFGLDFAFPLLIRKERSKLEQTKIKLSSTRFEQNIAERQVLNQIDVSFNTLVNTRNVINQLSAMVSNYERMLQAEFLNLENGESDLFKINVQQDKLIQAQTKYLKMLSEFEKNRALLYWAAGVRNLGE